MAITHNVLLTLHDRPQIVTDSDVSPKDTKIMSMNMPCGCYCSDGSRSLTCGRLKNLYDIVLIYQIVSVILASRYMIHMNFL